MQVITPKLVPSVVFKVDLLDSSVEPSDAALKSMMGAVQLSARTRREAANRELFARIQRETKLARAHFGIAVAEPAQTRSRQRD